MANELTHSGNVYGKLMMIRQQPVIIDRDVATIYGVQTKVLNQAVKRNEDKFPPSYRFPLDEAEVDELVTNCDRFKTLKHSTAPTYAFTEKGLYMLATVLRSKIATEVTFEIIETFAAVKDLQRNLISLHNEKDREKQKKLMSRFSSLLSDIVLPELRPDESETSIELNFIIGKLKHTVKRRRRMDGKDEVTDEE